MRILIVQTGEPLHCDEGNFRPMRAMTLANYLVNRGHDVNIVSSRFFHQIKRHRTIADEVKINQNLTINLINSCGYKKNISFYRIFDHIQLAFRFSKVAESIEDKYGRPDFIYIGYPPIELAYTAVSWAKKRNIPSMVNVEDQWPDIFIDAASAFLKPVINFFVSPYKYLARLTFSKASMIGGVSESYVNWGLRYANRLQNVSDHVTYLTGDSDEISSLNIDAENDFRYRYANKNFKNRIIFVGTLSRGFDFEPLSHAIKLINKDRKIVEFVICGTGDKEGEVKELFKGVVGVTFAGWINRMQYKILAENSICTVAPYRKIKNFEENIPNKIIDSLYYGKPILTSLDGETGKLIRKHELGHSNLSNINDWKSAIDNIISNIDLADKYGENARKTYNFQFESCAVFNSLIEKIEISVMTHRDITSKYKQ